MADVFTAAKRSQVMAAVRSTGNRSTEMALVSAFRANRVTGWRRHYLIAGTPDFAFPRAQLAVFVDGCFWHGCPRCGSIPASNRAYWERKIDRNIKRDRKNARELDRKGWAVVRVWEHDLKGAALQRILRRIKTVLDRRLAKRPLTS